MIRGTTPTLKFKLPFDTELLAEAWVTFTQLGHTVVDKTLADLEKEGDTLVLQLTQDETLMFQHEELVEIQIRARLTDDTAVASQKIRVGVDGILKEGVI